MDELKIIDWINYDDAEEAGYRDVTTLEFTDINSRVEAVIAHIAEHGYKFSGFYHQNAEHGVPLFNDNTVLRVTQRMWGGIMAKALNLDDADGFAYLKWAWRHPEGEEQVTPCESSHHSILFESTAR